MKRLLLPVILLPLLLALTVCGPKQPAEESSSSLISSSPELPQEVQQAVAEREDILTVLQEKIAQYQGGQVVNNPLEPRVDPFPEGEEYPVLTSVEEFTLEEGNEMFGVKAVLPLREHTMCFFLSYFASPDGDAGGYWSSVSFLPQP